MRGLASAVAGYPSPVPDLSSLQLNLALLISVVLFVVKAFALVDCVARPAAQFTHRETVSKQGWLIILVLAVVGHLVDGFQPLALFSLIGTVAALVYLAQMRGSSR